MEYEEARFVHIMLMLDANAINARRSDPDLNQIERWQDDGVVHVIMSTQSSSEARAGGSSSRSAKALGYVYSYVGDNTENEQLTKRTIASILFPAGPRNDSERNDIDIVFHSMKYTAILVTNDGDSKRQPGGILGNRDKLARLGVRAMRPREVVGHIREKIAARDTRARELSLRKDQPLPSWVGAD